MLVGFFASGLNRSSAIDRLLPCTNGFRESGFRVLEKSENLLGPKLPACKIEDEDENEGRGRLVRREVRSRIEDPKFNPASWAYPAFCGDQGIAESVNLAIDFCWIGDGASDLFA